VFFVMQHEITAFRNISGITISEEVFDNKIALRELSLYGMLASSGLRLAWNYRTELFEASTVQRWTRNFLAVMQHVCLQPDCLLDEISLTPQSQESAQKEPVRDAGVERFRRIQPKAVDLIPRV
jgi:non-ribosomal peptide synthetase component F